MNEDIENNLPIQPADTELTNVEIMATLQLKHAWKEFNKQCARIIQENKRKKIKPTERMKVNLDGSFIITHTDGSQTLLKFTPLKTAGIK